MPMGAKSIDRDGDNRRIIQSGEGSPSKIGWGPMLG